MTPHLPFDRLSNLVEGRLHPEEQTEAFAHLSLCSICAAQFAWLQQTIELMRTDLAEDAPPHVIDRALELFRPQAAPAPSLLRRVQAVLCFDSMQMSPASSLREGQSAVRQLWFNAEEYDLDLRLTPAGEAWALTGQVLGPGVGTQADLQSDGGALEAELRGAAGGIQAKLNKLFEFTLPPVPAGEYELILRLREIELIVLKLQL